MDLRKLQEIHFAKNNGVDIEKAIKSGGLTIDADEKRKKEWKAPNMKGFKYGRQTGM